MAKDPFGLPGWSSGGFKKTKPKKKAPVKKGPPAPGQSAPGPFPSAPPPKKGPPAPGSTQVGPFPEGSLATPALRRAKRNRKIQKQKDALRFNEIQARAFRAEALSKLAQKHFEFDDEGRVKTVRVEEPVLKTNPKRVALETRNLKSNLKLAKKQGATPQELDVLEAAGARRIAKRNYELKDGQIQVREVEVPKLKKPKALRRELKRVNMRTQKIKKGKKEFYPTIRAKTKSTSPLGSLLGGIDKAMMPLTGGEYLEEPAGKAAKAVGGALKQSFEAGQKGRGAPGPVTIGAAGVSTSPGINAGRSALLEGIRTGLPYATEYLTRPGMAIEAMIAQGLSDRNSPIARLLIGEKGQKKLRGSAGPLDVLLHGHKAKKAATGGEITEATLGLPQAGLILDIATDPFMYIGGAGLPAKFGERAAALSARLAMHAPEALRSVEFTRLLRNAQKSGDYEFLVRHLEGLAKERGVSLRKLGKNKSEKAAIVEVQQALKERNRELADMIRKSREDAPLVGGQAVNVPGAAMMRAAEEVAAFGLRKQFKPGFTLELRTPFGRKLTGIEVPVPNKFAEKRIFPRAGALGGVAGKTPETTKLLQMARSSEANAQVYSKFADQHNTLLSRMSFLEASPTVTVKELAAAKRELAEFEDGIRASMMDARLANNATSPNLASLNEIMRSKNAKRFSHEIYRVTNAMGRQTQRVFFHHVMRALNPILHDKAARMRVGTHMAVEADTGARRMLDEIAPLTPTEESVLVDLNSIYKELEKYGFEVGTLKAAVENYFPRVWSDADEIAGPMHAGPLSAETPPMGGKRGAHSAYQQHRTLPEASSIADKQRLAQILRTIATKPITTKRSIELADQWFQLGKIRLAMEDMAQAVQRGQLLRESELTDVQKAAYEWSQIMESGGDKIPPLFQNLESTEGILKLHPNAFRYHNFVESPFGGMSARQEYRVKLSSALESKAKLEAAREAVPSGSPLAKHYDSLLKQRSAEIDTIKSSRPDVRILPRENTATGLPPDEAVTQEIRPGTQELRSDAAAAPSAEEVGLASDEEIADFVPNASDDYIGTLKDFRRDHPDKFPVLDPMVSNFYRSRAEGLQTAYRTRWQAFDARVGRSTHEAHESRYVTADGRSGYTHELKPDFGDGMHDKPVAYTIRGTDERIPASEIEFPGPTLIPNREYKLWYDPITGREYELAPNIDQAVGGAIQEAVGPDRLWPTDVIRDARAEFFRMGETSAAELFDSGLETAFQRVLTTIRYGVTVPFPAFHVRNMISDTLLSTLADPGFYFHPVSNAQLTAAVVTRGGKVKTNSGVEFGVNTVKVPHLGEMKTEDYLGVMDAFGLRSNQHIAEMARLAERGDVPELEKWWQGVHSYRRPLQVAKGGFGLGPAGAVGRRAIEASARREDIMRIITFTQRMRRNNGDFADAMWWTIKHHFDYGDLTGFERRWMRNLFLFYTWYRKNIPLQFMSIITRPGFFSGVTNAYIDLAQGETPLNFDWSEIHPALPDMSGPLPNAGLIPDYMLTQLGALTSNWNGHAMAVGFGAPWNDMNLISHLFESPGETVRAWGALFNPAFSLPFQYAFQSDLLTGRKFEKREASGPASVLNWIESKFGLDYINKKDDNGNPVLPWQLNLAFNQLPIIGRATGYFRSTPETEDPGRINKWFGGGAGSFLTGLNVYMSPKSGDRLHAAYISRVIARAAQRASLSEQGGTDMDLAQFDRETRVWAKERGIPAKYLEVVPGIGPAYITEDERQGFKLGGSGTLKGLTGGTGGLGGLDFTQPAREFGSQGEESLWKLKHPGGGDSIKLKGILGQSLVPIGSGGAFGLPSQTQLMESGIGAASDKQLNAALGRLRANKAARTAGPPAPPPQKMKGYPKPTHKPRVAGPKKRPKKEQSLLDDIVKSIFKDDKKRPPADKLVANKLKKKFPDVAPFLGDVVDAAKQYGVPPNLLIAIYDIETDFGRLNEVTSSAGAQGHMQFMPATWEAYGVDANRNKKASPYERRDAMFSAANYLRANYDQSGSWDDAIFAYNHADWYVNDVKGRAAAYDSPLWAKVTKAAADNKGVKLWGGKKRGKISGDISGITNETAKIGRAIAGISGQKIDVISGARPGAVTTSGNVSDHASGQAIDIHALDRTQGGTLQDERRGNKIAWAAGVAAGVDPKDPDLLDFVKRGGVFEAVSPSGYRVQILWKTDTGGNHHNHVHVGISGGAATGGVPSYTSSGTSYGLGAAAPAGGGPNYKPGRSQQVERSVQQMRQRMGATGGSSSTSLGTGALLTTTEAFNLGSAAEQEGKDVVDKLRRALAAMENGEPAPEMPKLNLKAAKL